MSQDPSAIEPDAQPTAVHDPAVNDTAAVQEHAAAHDPGPGYEPVAVDERATPIASAYAPVEDDDDTWEELPHRPRRRLLTPLPLALMAVLLVACGFIGGVLVEKGQNSSSGSTGGASAFASRLAALRGGSTTGTGTGTTGTGATGATGTGGAPSFLGGGGRTVGEVSYLSGGTLYVTNSEGNTVKVTTSSATSVTKTVKASVKSIHPGETVTVTGTSGSKGSVSAEDISVGSSDSGLAALFGGGGTGSRSSGESGATTGGQDLFGN